MKGPLPKDSVYRGESPPKKRVRILLYEKVRAMLKYKAFSNSNYLVIPSSCAGDLATLTAMGVCEHHIYCADIDKHAIAAARHKYPNAHYFNGPFWEVFKTFPSLKNNIGCAFIDLCCPLRAEVFGHVLDIGLHAKVLAFEFKYGREVGGLLESLQLQENASDVLKPRLEYVQRVTSRGSYFQAEQSWSYVSTSSSHVGSPMFVSVGRVQHGKPVVNTAYTQIKFTDKEVRDICMHDVSKHRLWNVAESTAIAWRAHESRGTYR